MSALTRTGVVKFARAMGRQAGSIGWSQTELKCLANAYEKLGKKGDLSKTQQEVVLYQLYKEELETLERAPAELTLAADARVFRDQQGAEGLCAKRSPAGLLRRWKSTDLPIISNHLKVYWQALHPASEPNGSTGTNDEDALELLRVMWWLKQRLDSLDAIRRKDASVQATRVARDAQLAAATAVEAGVPLQTVTVVDGRVQGSLADSQDEVIPPTPAPTRWTVEGLDNKDICGGLDEGLMAVVGVTHKKMESLQIMHAQALFQGLEHARLDEFSKVLPPCWEAWIQHGPSAPENARFSHMNPRPPKSSDDRTGSGPSEDSRAACRGAGRTPGVGSKRRASSFLADFNPEQTMVMLQLITANKSGSKRAIKQAYKRACEAGLFIEPSGASESDEEAEEEQAASSPQGV